MQERGEIMTYVVTGRCIDCKYTDCVAQCPVDAFHETDKMVVINPEVCIDCDACLLACPVEAIFPENLVPDHLKNYIQVNADLCKTSPGIFEKKQPLPTAKTLEVVLAEEKANL